MIVLLQSLARNGLIISLLIEDFSCHVKPDMLIWKVDSFEMAGDRWLRQSPAFCCQAVTFYVAIGYLGLL